MTDLFIRDYFMQTRKEIDTEKHERDRLLHFVIIVIGALAFAVIQSEAALRFAMTWYALGFEVAGLAAVTSLFWVRRKKLNQIADRWHVLLDIVRECEVTIPEEISLERIVVQEFDKRRYLKKDLWLCVIMCAPLHVLVLLSSLSLQLPNALGVLIFIAVVGVHGVFAHQLLWKKKLTHPGKKRTLDSQTD